LKVEIISPLGSNVINSRISIALFFRTGDRYNNKWALAQNNCIHGAKVHKK
jgi:hypothetical protein